MESTYTMYTTNDGIVMIASILYAIVVRDKDGGQKMKTFLNEDDAISEGNKLVNTIKENGMKGFEIYMSELEYDKHKDRLLSNNLINKSSELLIRC